MRRLGLLALLAIAALGAGAGWLESQISRPYRGFRPEKVFVDIPRGTSRWGIAGMLRKSDIIRNRIAFTLFSDWHFRTPASWRISVRPPGRLSGGVLEDCARPDLRAYRHNPGRLDHVRYRESAATAGYLQQAGFSDCGPRHVSHIRLCRTRGIWKGFFFLPLINSHAVPRASKSPPTMVRHFRAVWEKFCRCRDFLSCRAI